MFNLHNAAEKVTASHYILLLSSSRAAIPAVRSTSTLEISMNSRSEMSLFGATTPLT
ncbi:hypothetical protein [Pontibacter diazotrophicus]|uniref:hypothetical protein n=1 Tax=Pontibacter diazotrophicus TaxID=1400979 RepID=UPI0015F16601|nr:hypothetical protein [Pontibacter diazotrophicus]